MSDLNKRVIEATIRRLKRKPARFNKPIFPKAIERSYNNEMQSIANAISKQIKENIIPLLPSIARDLGQDTVRKDAGVDDVTKAVQAIKSNLFRTYTDAELTAIAKKKGMSLLEFNAINTEKEFKRVLGVDLFTDNRPLAGAVDFFSAFNVQLSKSLIDESVQKVQSKILAGFQSGTRWEEIAKDIEEFIEPSTGQIANRARLIARDQISKLNGVVTKERQTSLGISKYTWRTSGDERVRDSHRALEGQVIEWDNPPSVGHPGEDFNCRCTAEPILDQFFNE